MAQSGQVEPSSHPAGGRPAESRDILDVAIVGGGLAGTAAAVALARAGLRVALIDVHASVPAGFKAEKLEPDQIALLRQLGLMDGLLPTAIPIPETLNIRHGQVIDRTRREQFGVLYHEVVAGVRRQLPTSVDLRIAHAISLETGTDCQRVDLATGESLQARLVVLASGLGFALAGQVGIGRRVIRERHSLAFGFYVTPAPGAAFDFRSLIYYGERVADRIDYLSLFAAPGGMRANFFTYRDSREAWARDFARAPRELLVAALPGLHRFLGDFAVPGRVQMRPIDLVQATDYRRAGVVLLGDAFQTSCPATGTGVSKVLTDVAVLVDYVPGWLASPGMGLDKIARYYDDPRKRLCDAKALRWAEYRRALSTETGLGWEMHRRQVFLRRRLRGWIAETPLRLHRMAA